MLIKKWYLMLMKLSKTIDNLDDYKRALCVILSSALNLSTNEVIDFYKKSVVELCFCTEMSSRI